MRLKAGDDLLVFNGRDGEWRVSVAEVLKKGVILRAEEQLRPQAYGPDLELIVAVVKKARVETIVEKAAELGVDLDADGVTHPRPTITKPIPAPALPVSAPVASRRRRAESVSC